MVLAVPDVAPRVLFGMEGTWRFTADTYATAAKDHFNDRTGTQFEDSKLPLRVWFFAAFLT